MKTFLLALEGVSGLSMFYAKSELLPLKLTVLGGGSDLGQCSTGSCSNLLAINVKNTSRGEKEAREHKEEFDPEWNTSGAKEVPLGELGQGV